MTDQLSNSKFKGEYAQLRVQLAAAHKGIPVAIPTTPERFDIILIDKDKLLRCQIKYCDRRCSRTPTNTLELMLYNNRNKKECYTKDSIDLLLVYVPQVDRILAFGPEIFHNKKTITIELKNNNSRWYWSRFKW